MKSRPTLTKTRTVLVRTNYKNGNPVYSSMHDDDPRTYTVMVDNEVAIDMNNPELITVTIEPGDLLNV